VLALAQHPNVHLKFTGMPSLSRSAYPYAELRDPVRRAIDAFGSERCFWASDMSFYRGQIGWGNRFPTLVGDYPGKHTYAQAVGFWHDGDWLDDDTKADLLGRSARRIFRWPSP
jgi:predicted TIM-barrel fold metal-dependent hydrolase